METQKYQRNRPCVKCGWNIHHDKHGLVTDTNKKLVDIIFRECGNCGYRW